MMHYDGKNAEGDALFWKRCPDGWRLRIPTSDRLWDLEQLYGRPILDGPDLFIPHDEEKKHETD